MLTKFEIDAQYYKSSKHFINNNETAVNTSDVSLSFLIDNEYRLVGIARNPMTCKSLANFDKTFIVNLYEKSKNQVLNLNIPRNECWRLSFNISFDGIQENTPVESVEKLKEYFLTTQKVAALDHMHLVLDHKRKPMREGLTNQEFIYVSKYLEAKEILKNKIEIDLDLDYPYTSGYANVMNLTLQEAATAIVLQHNAQSGFLAESENIRIKYKNLIINETDISQLKVHLENFITEHEKYSSI